MLQLLETGRALYVLAAFCLAGIFARLQTQGFYKRMMKESGNMTLTKNRSLMELKQKAESTYRINQGNLDVRVFVENQMRSFKNRGMTLVGWSAFANQLTRLCFFLGGVGAFFSYWYRLDMYYVVLYGAGGILLGMLSMMFDSGINTEVRQQQLLATLTDYIENTLFARLSKSLPEEGTKPEKSEVQRPQVRDLTRLAERPGGKRPPRSAKRESAETAAKTTFANRSESGRGDTDYLKRSLEQIAASREKNRTIDENWLKDLGPEEVELIGEILKEYLA